MRGFMELRREAMKRWVGLSLRHPWRIIAVGTVLFWASVFCAARLDLKSDFIELLPTDSPSVMNLEFLKGRVSSYRELTVAIECPDLETSMRFADALVERLKKFPKDRIRYLKYNLRELTEFYKANKWLYADLADLTSFRARMAKRIEEETAASVVESLDADSAPPKTDLGIDDLKKKYEARVHEQDRYPDGYYVTPDRTLVAVFVWPPSTLNSHEDSLRLVQDVRAEVDALNPSSYHPQMQVGFTGEVQTGIEERDALAADMEMIGILSIILILGVIVVFYRSLRAVLLIGMPMLLGLVMAFAVAYFAIGYLNMATAFLVSIVAGNGINFMIMLAARFFEEIRRRGHEALPEALEVAVLTSARGTFVAGAAAAIAYGSLVLAGFRGFRQFGIIGGAGMMLCWIATFAIGPALIVALHRMRPLAVRQAGDRQPVATAAGRLVDRHPRAILLASLLLSCASVLFLIPYSFDPFEYDFHNLRNRVSAERGSAMLSHRIDEIFELPRSPTPVLAESLEDVPRIERAILEGEGGRAVIGDVGTIFDLLPAQQEEKLAVLADIRGMIDRKIDFLPKEDRKDIEEYRPPETLRVLTVADVPELQALPYTEVDGTRGRIMYAYSKPGNSLLDGRYLLKFARYLRGVRVDGKPVLAVGQAMVFADMVAAVVHDGVVVTIASAGLVLLLLIAAFRRVSAVAVMLASVGMGTLWMLGGAAAFDLKLNFLNFAVIPITLGIGVDYGANLYTRFRQDGADRVVDIIRSTGGAVVASSLTTIIGYATLILSMNMALQSFGIIADIGEFTCLAAAELTMTALLVWMHRSRKAG